MSSENDNLLDDDALKLTNGDLGTLNDDEKETMRSSYKMDDDEEDLVIESESEEDDDTLNLTGQNLDYLPTDVCKAKGAMMKTLILTKNKLVSLKGLEYFTNLSTLQLDRNGLKNINDFPKLTQLKTLWLNNNNLQNLHSLLLILKKQVCTICILFCEYASR